MEENPSLQPEWSVAEKAPATYSILGHLNLAVLVLAWGGDSRDDVAWHAEEGGTVAVPDLEDLRMA